MKTDWTMKKIGVSAGLVLLLISIFALPVFADIDLGSFTAKVDTSVGTNPTDVAIGDLDGDGKLDVAVSNFNSDTVSVLLNTSIPGTISFSATIVNLAVTGPRGIVIGDLDGDGKRDLVVANYGTGSGGGGGSGTTISAFLNTSSVGSISFTSAGTFAAGGGALLLALGDIDGDGKSDLAVSNWGVLGAGTTVSLLRNTSTSGSIAFAAATTVTTNQGPIGVALGDIDGDGKRDLAVANEGDQTGSGNTFSVFLNTSTIGTISFGSINNFTTGAGPWDIALADLDGDSSHLLDVAVTNYGGNGVGSTVSVFRNTSTSGSVSFAAVSGSPFTTGTGPLRIVVGDVDQDGKLEIITSNFQGGSGSTISVLRNTSTSGSIAFAAKVDFTTGGGPRGLAFGDIDAPTRRDVVVANAGSGGSGTTFSVLRNTNSSPTAVGLTSFTGEARAFDWFEPAASFAENALVILGALMLFAVGWFALRDKRR
jgi:hypothetical protein